MMGNVDADALFCDVYVSGKCVTSLCWRPDGKVIAAGFEDGYIALYDVEVCFSYILLDALYLLCYAETIFFGMNLNKTSGRFISSCVM